MRRYAPRGDVVSVRKIHARVGGSYNLLMAEVRALREERAVGLPTVFPALPDERAPIGEERDGVLLTVTPRVADALEQTRQALREDTRLYHDCVLFLAEAPAEPHQRAHGSAGGVGGERGVGAGTPSKCVKRITF